MKYLLAVSIGPVQDFIAAARKTSDLKAGSKLLSDAAQAAARVLCSYGTLILPADAESDAIPNKILLEVNDGQSPEEASSKAREAIVSLLNETWTRTCEHAPKGVIDLELAQAQLNHFLEFYSAWTPYENEAKYSETRKKVEWLLSARKSIREFGAPLSRSGMPKSPLDPTRDCVLHVTKSGATLDSCHKWPLMLKQRETLDAISLLKRIKGMELSKRERIPSTSLMAAKSILPKARKSAREQYDRLNDFADRAGNGLDISDFLYPSRLEDSDTKAILEEAGIGVDEAATIVKSLLKAVGKSECPPYYAILVADGDHMGEKLSQLKTPDEHRNFSLSMAQFAEQAWKRINDFDGYCVYAGGDDVLVLLPVNQAIACADTLAELFRENLKDGSLSAGLAIVHHQESLQTSIERAREAEREAKKERNSLAVALHTRGGGPAIFSSAWEDSPSWEDLIDAFRSELSHGFPYEMRSLAMEWKGVPIEDKSMQNEALRILKRKKGGVEDENSSGKAAGVMKNAIQTLSSPDQMRRFADRLVIARFLATYPEAEK